MFIAPISNAPSFSFCLSDASLHRPLIHVLCAGYAHDTPGWRCSSCFQRIYSIDTSEQPEMQGLLVNDPSHYVDKPQSKISQAEKDAKRVKSPQITLIGLELTTRYRCVACRQSKIKCSGEEPCTNCRRRVMKCRFVETGGKVMVAERFASRERCPLLIRS